MGMPLPPAEQRASLVGLLGLCLAGSLTAACAQSKSTPGLEVEVIRPQVLTVPLETPSEEQAERAACEGKMKEVLAQPAVPGAPESDENRLKILTRAKAEPVLLVDEPQFRDE